MATEIKKVNEINPSVMNMADIKTTAIAVLAGEYEDPDEISETVLQSLVDTYAEKSLKLQYGLAKDSGNPMKYLCETFFYPTIRIKGKEDEREIEDSAKRFDLIQANKEFHGIGAKPSWVLNSGLLCTDFAYHAAKDLGDEKLAKFLEKNRGNRRVLKIQAEIESGKNPVSKTKLMPALERVIQEMLGEEYHISKYDYAYIDKVFINDKSGSATAVTDHNHKGFSKLLMKVCHRVLTGGTGYEVESRLVKKEK